MSADFESDLQRELESLSSDTRFATLGGPDAARRRARQRTRNQAIGAVLGAAVIVGGGVIAVAQPNLSSAPDFANTPSQTDPSSTTPSPTSGEPSDEPSTEPVPDVLPLTDAVLLTEQDLEQDGGSPDWQRIDPPRERWACAPDVEPADGRQTLQRSFGTDGSRLDHIVEASTPAEATARFESIRDAVTACVEALSDEFGFGWISAFTGLGDDAWQASYFAPPREGDAATLVRIDLVRSGLAVTSVSSGGFAMDDNYPPSEDRAVAATNRLCEQADGACATQVERQLLFPEGAQNLAGWLTAADVAETAGLSAITQATEVIAKDDGSLGFVCFEQNALASGATSVLGRSYVDPTDPAAEAVEEVVVAFPTGDESVAYYEALVAEGDSCTAESDISVENTGSEAPGSQDGFGFTTLRATSNSTGSTWVMGLAVDGPVVIYINYGTLDHDVSAEQMQALLERAVARYTNP
jgi:chitodextrinase